MGLPPGLRLLALGGLLPRHSDGNKGSAQADATCSAAGTARAAFRHREAVAWLADENLKRAPYYLEAAKRKYKKGLRQFKGSDKSNSDPFITLYDAQHQVLGALDLAPNNASIWLGAGQVTAMLASLDEDKEEKAREALKLLARACTMDESNVAKIIGWSTASAKTEDKAFTEIKVMIRKEVMNWRKTGKVPKSSVKDLLPFLTDRAEAEVCDQGLPMDPIEEGVPPAAGVKDQIKAALGSLTAKPIFPTIITTVNVAKHFGSAFSERLADMAIRKYTAFSEMRKRSGVSDPNDINDNFFSAQATGEGQHQTQKAQQFWGELYRSKEYEQLRMFMRSALIEHAVKSGYPPTSEHLKGSSLVLWAAVYLSDGGRHGYHVHQAALSSCVFYAKTPPGKTPIMFVDPRGAPPTHDYEQHLGEHDFEPTSPFHHNYHFFAEAGDLVCFPSWLVHRVPSHHEQEPRVAFPANLGLSSWDAWYRSATLP